MVVNEIMKPLLELNESTVLSPDIISPLTQSIFHLNLTFHIGHSDMRQGGKTYSDMGHSLFLNSTCDIGEISDKDMRYCQFLKSTCDIEDPPSTPPPPPLQVFLIIISIWLYL